MSGSDIHDFVQLGPEGQVTPTNYTAGGVQTTVSSPNYIAQQVTAQISTQTNPSSGIGDGLNSITSAAQSTAIIGPVYYSPGGILNNVGPANFNLVTGGGP